MFCLILTFFVPPGGHLWSNVSRPSSYSRSPFSLFQLRSITACSRINVGLHMRHLLRSYGTSRICTSSSSSGCIFRSNVAFRALELEIRIESFLQTVCAAILLLSPPVKGCMSPTRTGSAPMRMQPTRSQVGQ